MTDAQRTAEERASQLAELLKRATFLLGTLCLAHGTYPDNVARLLDDADAVLKQEKRS